MKKLTKVEMKAAFSKSPDQLSKEELSFLFYIFSFQIKEYYSGKNNISFEIHYERTFIVRVHYPIDKGLMSFNNEFVNFGEGCHGISMPRVKDSGELIKLFINMFYKTLLSEADYTAYYDEEESLFSSEEETTEYLQLAQSLI